jgi:hypothetical protein
MNDAFPTRRKKHAIQKSKPVLYVLSLKLFNNAHSSSYVVHDRHSLFTTLRTCINHKVHKSHVTFEACERTIDMVSVAIVSTCEVSWTD